MATPDAAVPSRAERLRQQANERRSTKAAEFLSGTVDPSQAIAPRQSFAAQTLGQALPLDLVRTGRITVDPQGRPHVAEYDPALLAPNPQRGRVADRGLEELAASLDTHGQQEPILGRIITAMDRQRWPDKFKDDQILLILKGHRIYHAFPKTKLTKIRVELLLPRDSEDDLTYSRRSLQRASIKMMHSQGYDIFDKVQLFEIWKAEFALEKPKDAEIAGYFEIGRAEAQRLKVVATLDEDIAREIINSDRRPADEVVFQIANRPPDEQREAFTRYGHLTVAELRRVLVAERTPPATAITAAGRPRNYVLAVRNDDSEITYISTDLTPLQWKKRGGARAFWKAIQALGNTREVQDRLKEDLG